MKYKWLGTHVKPHFQYTFAAEIFQSIEVMSCEGSGSDFDNLLRLIPRILQKFRMFLKGSAAKVAGKLAQHVFQATYILILSSQSAHANTDQDHYDITPVNANEYI